LTAFSDKNLSKLNIKMVGVALAPSDARSSGLRPDNKHKGKNPHFITTNAGWHGDTVLHLAERNNSQIGTL